MGHEDVIKYKVYTVICNHAHKNKKIVFKTQDMDVMDEEEIYQYLFLRTRAVYNVRHLIITMNTLLKAGLNAVIEGYIDEYSWLDENDLYSLIKSDICKFAKFCSKYDKTIINEVLQKTQDLGITVTDIESSDVSVFDDFEFIDLSLNIITF